MPMLTERQRLGPVLTHAVVAPTMPEAHRTLGALLREPAASSIERRLSLVSPDALQVQLRDAVESLGVLRERARAPAVAETVRGALVEYLACLEAWAGAVGLAALTSGRRVLPIELALWAQDDNVGCQTGMMRRAEGSVLFWHIEEDSIGYFDRPRLAAFSVGAERHWAFLYPYLLPGPAFGFCAEQLHAVDSLFVRRGPAPRGVFTNTLSWLVWRLGPAVEVHALAQALQPYVDGCAINVVRPGSSGVHAATHEVGGGFVLSRTLGARPGARQLQVNIIHRAGSRFGREEDLSARERSKYVRRRYRMEQAVRGLGHAPEPDAVLRMLTDRRGGRYALANARVKAHAVAVITTDGFEVYVESGAAEPGDVYRPQWRRP